MLIDFLENTSLELSCGVPEIYKDHPTAISIRNEGKKILEGYLPDHLTDYKVEGSAGRGQ
ncbi:DUF3578 domain-containing protein [Gammaproteobacteria bacterium]|nr:DUF3578 domain-containing protein [Gammaproteobacteria bacterium]